jgi:transmembrane sensor
MGTLRSKAIRGCSGRAAVSQLEGSRRRAAGAVMTVAVLLSAGALFWFAQPHAPTVTTYATSIGQQQQFELDDGTRFTLDTNSKIAVMFDDRHRDIQLVAGEVFVDVVHNPRRPLRMCAAGHLLSDLGTQFNVRVSPTGTTVTVKQGEVEVSGRCKVGKSGEFFSTKEAMGGSETGFSKVSSVLTSGEQATIMDHGKDMSLAKRKLTRSQMDNLLAWQDGLLIFDNTPIQEALDQMNRYFPQRMEIADPSLDKIRVSGMYNNSTMDSILRALEETYDIVPLPSDTPNPVIRLVRIKSAVQR